MGGAPDLFFVSLCYDIMSNGCSAFSRYVKGRYWEITGDNSWNIRLPEACERLFLDCVETGAP